MRVRLTAEEKAALDAAAAAAGTLTATWLRDVGLAAAAELAADKPVKKPGKKS